ncbi:MAG: hypothetical protein IPO21_14455 [Bacteroidales bacterium]|nr:hypothetical protein [Bacteroidales bacterium]
MKEKILQKLKSQKPANSSVSDRTLDELASHYELFITTDELLEKADFAIAIKTIDGNINNHAAKAVEDKQTKLAKLEADFALAKKELEKGKEPEKQVQMSPTEKLLLDQLNEMKAAIAAITKTDMSKSRESQINELLKETPEVFKNTILNTFKTASFESDEMFETYKKTVETSKNDFVQQMNENGLKFPSPSVNVKKAPADEVSPAMLETIKSITNTTETKKPF